MNIIIITNNPCEDHQREKTKCPFVPCAMSTPQKDIAANVFGLLANTIYLNKTHMILRSNKQTINNTHTHTQQKNWSNCCGHYQKYLNSHQPRGSPALARVSSSAHLFAARGRDHHARCLPASSYTHTHTRLLPYASKRHDNGKRCCSPLLSNSFQPLAFDRQIWVTHLKTHTTTTKKHKKNVFRPNVK